MNKQYKEEFNVTGEVLLKRIKQLINEGNVRRITIKNKDNDTISEIPLTIGVVGAVLVPTLAAVGTIAALVTKCKLTVERRIVSKISHATIKTIR